MEGKTNNLVAKHARKYNKAAVHKDRKKALKKGDRKHKGSYESVEEVLKVSDGASAWIKDFQSSDAPQFKGKSMDKRREMALAAYLDAKKGSKEESVDEVIDPVTAVSMASLATTAIRKGRKVMKNRKNRKNRSAKKEDLDEVFTTTAIANFFKKSGDKKKYDKVVKDIKRGKYTVAKASQMFDLDGHILQSMVAEWSCNTTEKTRRVKGGDKRKKYMKEKQVDEKKGLWDRIHAKRKRGEKPAKPGDKDYPKTLDVGEGLKQARKNVGSDSCWDGYKATGTKMKGGKEVPDCKKEGTSAQSRLDRMAAKHGLGKPNKAADDYLAKMMKKYGAKDMADLKKKMGMKESMDPRDFTDKAGYLVVVKGKGGKEEIKNFFNTKPAAQKYVDRIHKTNKVGNTASIYKTDGRKMMKEDVDKAQLKLKHAKEKESLKSKHAREREQAQSTNEYKYQLDCKDHLEELTQRELDMMAARKQKNLVKRGKAKAEPKKPASAGRTQNTGRSGGEDDSSLVMQLRKAQDLRGNHDIQFKGGKTKLPKQMIDKLLNTYDKLSKPADKKKFETLVTHELRKKEGIATQKSKTAADKAMDKFNKTRRKGLPAPRGKQSGPSASDLRDIERGK